jgi:hypothetical protein
MQANEVPQEGLPYKGRDKVKKVVYATTQDGQYTHVNSIGWEAENVAMRQAWQDVEDTLQQVAAAVQEGRLSPLAWWMHKCLMDVGLLAKYASKWRWTVKKHLKPKGFNKLSNADLETYARVFRISVSELKNMAGA